MKPSDTGFTRENFKLLIDGKLPWEEVKKAIRLSPKDADRFEKYIEILQGKAPWEDRILLRISDHLYIVAKPGGVMDALEGARAGRDHEMFGVHFHDLSRRVAADHGRYVPPIAFAGVSSLYSVEFYRLARSRLKPGGFLTQWLPLYQVSPQAGLSMGVARSLTGYRTRDGSQSG